MNTGRWRAFFQAAAIPDKIGAEYASLFVDNRIQAEMLGDLTKELLNEMGIKPLGDVLAILKASKKGLPEEPAPKPAPALKETSQPTRWLSVEEGPSEWDVVKAGTEPVKKVRLADAPPRQVRPPSKSVLIIRDPEPAKEAPKRKAIEPPVGSNSNSSEEDCHIVKAVREARKSLKAAPDASEYVISMPKGSTPKSRELLRKAEQRKAGLLPDSPPVPRSTIFSRLGSGEAKTAVPGKKIKLRRAASPEVSSTTSVDEDIGGDLRWTLMRRGGGTLAERRSLADGDAGLARSARFGLPINAAALPHSVSAPALVPTIRTRLGPTLTPTHLPAPSRTDLPRPSRIFNRLG